MVSLWPWKGEDNSPASFEKALSALAVKIANSQTQLDSLRQRGRRFKALWTLYTSFAYLLGFIVLFLVVGWKNWTVWEYTALAGNPLLIYLVRAGIRTYYDYRIDTVTQRLEDRQAERAKTIEKLKAATKYNSTQELLEKYGATPAKPKKPAATKQPKVPKPVPGRTSTGPPPATANIHRPEHIPSQSASPVVQQVPNARPQYVRNSPSQGPPQLAPRIHQSQAEFAPNAFSIPPQFAHNTEFKPGENWYDRILDLLLGEDETLPKNRVALICKSCRLVNGQAPPGTKDLAGLGKWRCFGCGTLNGEEDEAAKAVQEMKEKIAEHDQPVASTEGIKESEISAGESGDGKESELTHEVEEDGSEEDNVEVKPRRTRSSAAKKKS